MSRVVVLCVQKMALHGETPFLLGLRVQYVSNIILKRVQAVMHHITVFRTVASRNVSGRLPYLQLVVVVATIRYYLLYLTNMPIRVVV